MFCHVVVEGRGAGLAPSHCGNPVVFCQLSHGDVCIARPHERPIFLFCQEVRHVGGRGRGSIYKNIRDNSKFQKDESAMWLYKLSTSISWKASSADPWAEVLLEKNCWLK